MRSLRWSAAIVLTAALAGLTACGDATGPGGGDSVTLSATAGGGGSTSGSVAAPSFSIEQSDGTNSLTLTRVAVVVRDVELEAAGGECDGDGGSETTCRDFESGPVLVELPLDGSVATVAGVDVPEGTYDEVEFNIHAPTRGSTEDNALLEEHPEFEDVSVRVEGTYNGSSFVFEQDLMDTQERTLSPALEVTGDGGSVNLTLQLDVSSWFVDAGGSLVDPETANKGGANENLVEENIRTSIDLIQDDDSDGVEN